MRKLLASLACAVALVLVCGAATAAGPTSNISTVAGTGTAGYSGDGGPATAAQLGVPVSVEALPDGGYLTFEQGGGVMRRVSPDGIITTIAGNGAAGYTGDGGPATSASMNAPSGGEMTADGGYLIADANNNAIRRVAPDGTMSTVVGDGTAAFGGDNGPANLAQVRFPYDVAVQPDGGYLIADVDNARIRRVGSDGVITTVAGGGSGGDGGPATNASLFKPSGVAVTADGGFLIADTYNNRVRKVDAGGTITTVAGTGAAGATGDGGPATAATLNRPTRVALTPGGGFVIADELNNRVRRVAPDGTITTVAGTGTAGYNGDGGPAIAADLNNVIGVDVALDGDILIADTSNHRIRFVDAAAPLPIVTGSSPASPANDNQPRIVGSASPGSRVNLFANGTCSGPPVATGPASVFAQPGLLVSVPDDSATTFFATATDIAGNVSDCSSSSVTYVESSTPPVLPPPVRGLLVNAIPETGTVLVKLPAGAAAKAHAAASGFVPLETVGRQLPVGSTLDTTQGRVLLTSATNTRGGTQDGHFRGGLFNIGQGRKNSLTTLSMTGSGLNSCSKLPRGGARKVAAARKRKRRTLFSDVKGRFRTRGRNSNATVRGTSWTMTDTCSGTLTRVKTGSVKVRDFTLRKTKVVKAGHSYLARAPLKKKRR
jgi:hypothetical protein